MSGNFAGNRDKHEVKNLKGESARTRSRHGRRWSEPGKRVDIDLASPRLDLTPFTAGDAGAKPKPQPKKPSASWSSTRCRAAARQPERRRRPGAPRPGRSRLGTGVLRDVDSTLLLEGGRLDLEGRVRDSLEGTVGGALKLTPADGGAVALDISVSAKNMRSSLGAGDAIDPKDAPPTNVEAAPLARGASARQMASGANGRIVVTQGPGKLPSGVIGLIGGDLLRELVGKLNPFAAQDPYTQLGPPRGAGRYRGRPGDRQPLAHTVREVTIVAGGKIDLGTEALRFDFNTRPRTGVGISGMFTTRSSSWPARSRAQG